MTDEEKKNTGTMQGETKSAGKDFSEKAGEVIEKVTEGAKVAGEKAGEAFDTIAEGAKKAGVKAGEVLEDLTESTKKVSAKAGKTASSVASTILTGVRKVSEKAADSVKILEIKHEISKLESDNKKKKAEITEEVLNLYKKNLIKEPTLINMCKEIEANNKLVEKKLEEIEEVRTTEGA
ncbi:MAG: hypothetical protein J7L66_01110 [Anaerolineaceae bacterium]|nr:hypothetical protein [Anaerolineaceae bacterium]